MNFLHHSPSDNFFLKNKNFYYHLEKKCSITESDKLTFFEIY